MNEVDQRLEEAGAEIRATAVTLPVRGAPGARQRKGARAAVVVATVGLAAVFIVAPLVWLNGSSTPGGTRDVAAVGQQAADLAGDMAGFPYLLIDADRIGHGTALVGAFDEEIDGTDAPGEPRLWTFGPPGASTVSPRIWLVSVPAGSDYFRSGDRMNESGWDPIQVEQGQAVLRTGSVGTSIMWTPWDTSSEVIFAHGFLVDPGTLTGVFSSLEKEGTGWVPQFLPDGFIELYDGPTRSDGRLVAQSWAGSEGGGDVEMYLIDNGPDGGEQALNELLAFTVSDREIRTTDVRGKPALVYAVGNETVYQWMETTNVAVRLVVRGLDPASVLSALVLVDQGTWEATLSTVMASQMVEPVPTTVAPSNTDS